MGNSTSSRKVAPAPSAQSLVINGDHVAQLLTNALQLPSSLATSGRYRLKFTFEVFCYEEGKDTTQEMVDEALAMCKSKGIWQPYLETTMEDAVTDLIQSGGEDHDFYPLEYPHIRASKIRIKMRPTQHLGLFTGFIEWSGPKIEMETLGEAVEWRIGDRMSGYEIQSEAGGWATSIQPGRLTFEEF